MIGMEQDRYHQPRWMNAAVIVWSSVVIAGWIFLPKAEGRLLTLVGLPVMLIVVGIVNKVRVGKFAPRWDELGQIKASQQRSRFEQLFIASLVTIATPITAGLLALSLGHYLDPTSPLVAAATGLTGLICGLTFAAVYAFRVVRRVAQSQ